MFEGILAHGIPGLRVWYLQYMDTGMDTNLEIANLCGYAAAVSLDGKGLLP